MYKGCIRSTIDNDLVVYVEKRKTKKDISGSTAAEKKLLFLLPTARCVLSFSADEDLAPNFLKRGFGWALIVAFLL